MEIPSYFKRYLAAIQPSKDSRQRAARRHATLRDNLAGDEDFQDVYLGAFLYGSYRRNTTIKRIKDVDVCVDHDASVLDLKPRSVVARLKRVLERNGYAGMTAYQRRSVRVDYAETTLDVVPVVDRTKEQGCFLIPDRTLNEWVETHPKAHIEKIQERNRDCSRKFVPLSKIVKAWYRYQTTGTERPKPKGFTLEAILFALQDQDAPSYAEAFVNFLGAVDAKYGARLARGTFPDVEDPANAGQYLRISVSEDEAKSFGRIVKDSLALAREALDLDGTVKESAEAWRKVFGPDFPITPSTAAKALTQTEAVGDEDVVGVVDEDEIESDGLPDDQSQVQAITTASVRTFRLEARLALRKELAATEHYPSNGRSLPKGIWLEFRIPPGTVSGPFVVKWIVVNRGAEARHALGGTGDMGHVTEEAGRAVHREHTAYRGSHDMVCEVYQAGYIVARARHGVNVK